MNYRSTTLDQVEFRAIYQCFSSAFSDYMVNVAATPEAALLRRASKNGWQPSLSLGLLANDELVAITLIGIDEICGEKRAYDILTGIVPGHRGKGLAGKIMDELKPMLKSSAVSALQLEVLQPNDAAIRAYKKAGFTTNRGLVCFAATSRSLTAAICPFEIRIISAATAVSLTSELDYEPSFEQRDFSITYLEDELLMLGAFDRGECIGIVVHDPASNWLMRLLTSRNHRRRGVASTLVYQLSQRLPANTQIKANNIDARDTAMIAALQKCGFTEEIRQWEMRLELS